MTHRERFLKTYLFEPVDRVPVYFFGAWTETKKRWIREGFTGGMNVPIDEGPQLPGMDPDWETGMWGAHGSAYLGPFGDVEPKVLEDRGETRVVRNGIGKVELIRADGGSISHVLEFPLKPTRESWQRFRRYLDPAHGKRHPDNMREVIAARNGKDIVTGFLGGSLYGWLRDFMGVEQLSYLMYDDPALLSEMVETVADHFMALLSPVLETMKTEFVSVFEDCCGSHGPLFSPSVYREIFDPHYRRLLKFYKDRGVPLALIDSDGMVEPLVPCWLESGFDIIFPVEVGKWGANPGDMRRKFGANLRMFGGVDKHFIHGDEDALRGHLQSLLPETRRGGLIPIPDHRIPPDVSFEQMMRYIRVFHQVFNG